MSLQVLVCLLLTMKSQALVQLAASPTLPTRVFNLTLYLNSVGFSISVGKSYTGCLIFSPLFKHVALF